MMCQKTMNENKTGLEEGNKIDSEDKDATVVRFVNA